MVYGTPPNGLKDTAGQYIDGGKNSVAILSKSGATIDAVDLPQRNRPASQTAAIVDALLSQDGLAGLRHSVRREGGA